MDKNETSTPSCRSCNRPDTADAMVACDACGHWHHFGCVGVDASVEIHHWICSECKVKGHPSGSNGAGEKGGAQHTHTMETRSKKVAGSKTSSRYKKTVDIVVRSKAGSATSHRSVIEEQLKLLEEQERLKEEELQQKEELERLEFEEKKRQIEELRRRQEEESKLREEKLAKQKALQEERLRMKQASLEKRQELIRQHAQMSDRGSSISGFSASTEGSKVEKWLTDRQDQNDLQNQGTMIPTTRQASLPLASPRASVIGINTPHISRQPPSVELHQHGQIASQLQNLSLHDLHSTQQVAHPSLPPAYMQIAARQVTGKDLPVFNGNPEDWPMFIRIFEETTAACGFSNVENQVRLQKCLRGIALETVRSRLLMPEGVPHVIKTLEMRFGRPELIIRSMLDRIQRLPAPKPDRLETVIDFGLAVQNLVVHLQAAKQDNHLNNPTLLQELVGKLPAQLKLDWARYKILNSSPTLATFGNFMEQLVQAASEVSFEVPIAATTTQPGKSRSREKPVAYSYSHDKQKASPSGNTEYKKKPKACSMCGDSGHRLWGCDEFKKIGFEDRTKFVRQNNLCRTCLNFHQKWPCKTFQGCNVDGCQEKHHPLLHPPVSREPMHLSTSHSSVRTGCPQSLPFFRILPVVLFKDGVQMSTFAFIDEGSSSTLLDRSVADALGLNGPVEPLTLQWTGNVTRKEKNSQCVQVQISGRDKSSTYSLVDARTVDKLLLPKQSLPYRILREKFPHLRGLPIEDYDMVEPKLLIGVDNLRLGIPLKIREGRHNEPTAAKCRLGWTIYGGGGSSLLSSVTVNFHTSAFQDPDHELNQQLNDYFTLDQVGAGLSFPIMESEADKRARRLLSETTRRVGNRFETGLLWKADDVQFPNSYPMAVKRLEALEKKLNKEPDLRLRVQQQLDDYIAKGYCHRASIKELAATDDKSVWYLPLSIVFNPRKPNKIRLVWDAAAQVNGISFNSALLKGPDLLVPLVAVLSHFREHKVAVSGDIKEMFLRMLIRAKDRQAQRFLWREDRSETPQIYVIDVATFGSTCSPSSAQFVKNLNAQEYMQQFPRAATAIVKFHYVDDYLDSFATVEEAIETVQKVKYIHSMGGFEIRNFLSNSEQVLAAIHEECDENGKELNITRAEKVESVLGMKWTPNADVFSYAISPKQDISKIFEPRYVPTKREMLKVVMSLFDPLGLVTFFLIHGRILIQDAWAAGIGWDTLIDGPLYHNWQLWIRGFQPLKGLRVPRNYFQHTVNGAVQLHVFVDASTVAYACVAYFAVFGPKGMEVTLISAKGKVAPIKVLSVPRLELNAAVLGTRLAESVINSHSYQVDRKFFWTDSRTVLAWINSDHRRYHQFVAVRIGEILSSTRMNEWRYVPSGQNPADLATKWGNGPSFDMENQWFRGPAFLQGSEDTWPKTRRFTTATELNNAQHIHWRATQPVIDVARFSKWERLQRTQAYVLRFVNNLKCQHKGEALALGMLSQS
ncbi:uncharacterized protein LOC134284819 [Aedes albopictus]|uniref:PHD-type domain-containing protein n=1 Tax=Aedes albopictus TaxID=7160 RepID=A0ABM1XXN5_AEDAL